MAIGGDDDFKPSAIPNDVSDGLEKSYTTVNESEPDLGGPPPTTPSTDEKSAG